MYINMSYNFDYRRFRHQRSLFLGTNIGSSYDKSFFLNELREENGYSKPVADDKTCIWTSKNGRKCKKDKSSDAFCDKHGIPEDF